MWKPLITLCSAALLAACATTSATQPTGEAPPARQKQAITNNRPFDVMACPGHPLALEPLTEEVVIGALLTRGPAFEECLLRPDARAGTLGALSVKATVAPDGVAVAVTGEGLSASGRACLEAAVKAVPFPTPAAGTAPLSGEVPVTATQKPLARGANAVDDAVAAARLELPALCRCFEGVPGPAPSPTVQLKTTTGATPVVRLEGLDAQPALATCLAEGLAAAAYPDTDVEAGFPLFLIDGWADATTPGAPAALGFQQLETARARHTALVLIAGGHRGAAAAAYDAAVARYKAKPTASLIPELKAKCAAVLAADDAHLDALKGLAAATDAGLQLAVSEKPHDAAWAQVEQSLTQQREKMVAEAARVAQQRTADEAACPKVK